MPELTLDVGTRYNLIEKLGEGGMGAVYLVEDTTSGKQVALKALLGQAGMDEASFLGFKQEFRTMAKLRHPNTCEVYDYGRLPDGTPYFTMEVVPGKGLDEALPLPAGQLPAILQQLCGALGYIHGQGFVHCDIKPENIRLRDDGVIKLMDFGLMELAGNTPEAIKGTLAYLAPEVARQDRIDARADIYSLGAMTYHLLTGQPPFKGAEAGGPIAILRAHLNEPPTPLRELATGVPALVESVVLRMLAKEPSSRYASTAEVLEALGLEADEGARPALLASPLVGRGAPLQQLQRALTEARGGKGQTIWLTGTVGAGKSRLVGEFRFAAQLDEMPFLLGTCDEHRTPYQPFVEALRQLLPIARKVCPVELAEHAPLLSRLLPELADGRPTPTFEPKEEKTLLQAAIADLILRAIAPTGGILALEDWDLAEPLSSETLAYLVRNAVDAPLLVLGTSCTPKAAQGEAIALEVLSKQDAAAMLAGMLGVKQVPDGLVAQLHELAQGTPGTLVNLLEHLLRTGALGRSRGKWLLPEAIEPENLPGDVQALLVERLAELSPQALQVAELAAVYGHAFGAPLASAILAVQDDVLFDALDEATRAKVLATLEQRQYVFVDAAVRHALYDRIEPARRTRLHNDLAIYLEARLQGSANATLADLTVLARHFLAASPTPTSELAGRAIRYALEAGTRSLEMFALDAARELLEAGLVLLDDRKVTEVWDEVRCDYLNVLATLFHWLFDLERANQYLKDGIPLAERLGDKARLLEMLVTQAKNGALAGTGARVKEAVELFDRAIVLADELGNVRTAVRSRVNLGRSLFFSGQATRAREVFRVAAETAREAGLESWYASSLSFLGYLEINAGGATREPGFARIAEAIAIQERIGDKGGLEYTYNLLFEVQLQAGRLREAEVSAQRNTALAKELGVRDDYVIGLLNQAILGLEMGRIDRALEVGGDCERVALELAHPVALPIVRAVLALAALYRGRYAQGVAQLRAAEKLARETSNYVYSIVVPFVVDGWLLVRNVQEALNAAQEALFMLRSMDDPNAQVRIWTYLAEIHGRMGQRDEGLEFADRAFAAARETDAHGSLARALRVKAWLLRQDRAEEARALAQQALATASTLGSDLVITQTLLVLGELALGQDPADAAQHFQTAQALADQMGAPLYRALAMFGQSQAAAGAESTVPLLIEAQRLLRGLAGELEADLQAAFMVQSDVGGVLEKIPGVQEAPVASLEDSQLTLERLQRVSSDLQNVASQYGVLFKEWSVKSGQLELLNHLARQVNETLQIDQVIAQVVHLTLEITRAERGFLLLRDEDHPDELVCHAAYNQFGRAIPHERSSMTVCNKVLASGQAVSVMDASADKEFQASRSIAALNLRTLMCVPLQTKGQTIGVLYVDSQAVVTTFTDRDLNLLEAIANHASVAIENATLYSTMNRRAAELERALEMFRKADYEASTDMLTGLRNRRYFQEQASREVDISRRYQRHLSALMLDVDHFKQVNDTYGHAAGDEVLKAVGLVIGRAVRSCDLAARLGGEEFVVLCPDTDAAGAHVVAERIREAVMGLSIPTGDGRPLRGITVSLGVAGLRGQEENLATLVDRADAALYASKAGGRNQVQIWRPDMVGEAASPSA